MICGTGNEPVVKSKMGHLLACRVAAKQGERTRSKLLHNLADGAFSKAVKDARTPLDWLSTDPAVVDAYIADDHCAQTITACAYATLTSLTAEVATLDSALEIPSELPILLVAGALDPVGNKGRGVKSTAALFEKAGIKDVEVKLYQPLDGAKSFVGILKAYSDDGAVTVASGKREFSFTKAQTAQVRLHVSI